MRSAPIISLVVGWVLLSQSPVAYAAPVPNQVDSVKERGCTGEQCRVIEPDTDTTTSLSETQSLVDVLINALQNFQALDSSTTV